MEQLTAIRQLIYNGKVEKALAALDLLLAGYSNAAKAEVAIPATEGAKTAAEAITAAEEATAALRQQAEAYYLRGNAYRKLSNWQAALNDYQRAIDLDPTSPAQQARRMVIDILNFYNKDMYNQ